MKGLVYVTAIETCLDLVAQIVAAAENVRQCPWMLEHVRQSMRRRCEVCCDHGSAHFEQLL